jgi:predicted enzyme related to lactoylglutathione lyase
MNRVVHFEIHAADSDAVQKFYEELFGWTFEEMGEAFGGYRVITTGPGPDDMAKGVRMEDVGINGGMTKRSGTPAPPGTSPNAFVCVIGVDDVDAVLTKAQSLGGLVAMEAMDMPGVGRIAYVLDPERSIFGIIKPEMRP